VHTQLYSELVNFPYAASLEGLDYMGVDYVVVHATYYPEAQWQQVRERLAGYSSRLTLLYNDGEGRVYALRRTGT
jgi:hypothetical protein